MILVFYFLHRNSIIEYNYYYYNKIYRIDGSKNEINHPNIKLVGYPTLYFFISNDLMNPIEYSGL